MSKLSTIEEVITAFKKECVGCDRTTGLEYCNHTMCRDCWSAENEEMQNHE